MQPGRRGVGDWLHNLPGPVLEETAGSQTATLTSAGLGAAIPFQASPPPCLVLSNDVGLHSKLELASPFGVCALRPQLKKRYKSGFSGRLSPPLPPTHPESSRDCVSEEVSGALPSLISLTVSVDVKPYVLLLPPTQLFVVFF